MSALALKLKVFHKLIELNGSYVALLKNFQIKMFVSLYSLIFTVNFAKVYDVYRATLGDAWTCSSVINSTNYTMEPINSYGICATKENFKMVRESGIDHVTDKLKYAW